MDAAVAPNIGAVAMAVSLIIVPAVSLLTAKMPQKHIDRVFGRADGSNMKAEA